MRRDELQTNGYGHVRASEELGRSFETVADGDTPTQPTHRGAAPERRAPGVAFNSRSQDEVVG